MTDQNSQFFAILTAIGEAKQANAAALGTSWTFAQMAVGDANGTDPIPSRTQTKLINERRRAPLNQVKVDPANASVIIAEQIIPESVGGWWVRELALYDTDGDMVAVANCAPTFKPLLAQGSGRTQVIRINLIVSSTANIELKIDPSVVLATREYVDTSVIEAISKLDFKHSVLVATTANIVLSGIQIIDGELLAAGARVLVKSQTQAKDNGIYVVPASGAWKRAPDADTSIEVTPGLFVSVEKGTVNSDSVWQLVTDAPIVLGTTDLAFEMVAGRTGIIAGAYGKVTVDKYGRVVGGTNPTTLAGFGITDAQSFAQILQDFATNGGWGLGQNTPRLVTDANTAIYPGFYSGGGTGAINFGDAFSPLLVMRRQSGNVIGQLQINARDNVLMFRGSVDNGATWTNWVSNWHSGNLVKTTSPTDTTPGSMLRVSDHGIGGQCIATETNLSLYRTGGKYVTPATGLVGLPTGWVQGRHTLDVCGGDSYSTQWLSGVGVNQGRTAFRTSSGAVYSPWFEIVHSGNYVGLAPGAIGGLEISSPADGLVTVATGRARDAADTTDIGLASAFTKRLQTSGAWAAGNNGNGLFSGVKAASTWYHAFIIKKDSDGSTDVGFDTSVTASNRPAGYSAYRIVGSVRTDSSGVIVPFIMDVRPSGIRRVRWVTPMRDAIDANVARASSNLTLSVPTGRSVDAELSILIYANNIMVHFSPLDTDNLLPTASSATGTMTGYTAGYGSVTDAAFDSFAFKLDVRTDNSAQIRARANTDGKYSLLTLGWVE